MKKSKGITLVVLVITIIILLILAGISIATLTGSGLFEKAKLAKQKSKEAQEKEEGILADYENKIGEYIDGNRDVKLADEVKDYIDTKLNRSAITATATATYTTSGSTTQSLKVNLDTIKQNSGSSFSIENGGIKIGDNVEYVLVSFGGVCRFTVDGGNYAINLYLNDNRIYSQGERASGSVSCHISSYQYLVKVNTDDILYLYDTTGYVGQFEGNTITVVQL